jgi:hypothetical protein
MFGGSNIGSNVYHWMSSGVLDPNVLIFVKSLAKTPLRIAAQTIWSFYCASKWRVLMRRDKLHVAETGRIRTCYQNIPFNHHLCFTSRFHIRRRTSRLDEQIVSKSSFSRTNHQMWKRVGQNVRRTSRLNLFDTYPSVKTIFEIRFVRLDDLSVSNVNRATSPLLG